MQDRTDAMISTISANDNIAFVGHDATHAPDGFYLARTLGSAYELDADTTLPELLGQDGRPMVLPKGSRVVDAWYYNMMPRKAGWYAPYEAGNAAGRVRVPSHIILGAGFEMCDMCEMCNRPHTPPPIVETVAVRDLPCP